MSVPAQGRLNGYELALISSSANQNQLSLNLVDANQAAYRSFVTDQSQVKLNAQGQNSMTAFLYDGQGQEIFLNASWTCA